MTKHIWLRTYDCSYMINKHMITHMNFPPPLVSYKFLNHIWIKYMFIYVKSYIATHIWIVYMTIYVKPYMNARIWVQYMSVGIWTHICRYMCTSDFHIPPPTLEMLEQSFKLDNTQSATRKRHWANFWVGPSGGPHTQTVKWRLRNGNHWLHPCLSMRILTYMHVYCHRYDPKEYPCTIAIVVGRHPKWTSEYRFVNRVIKTIGSYERQVAIRLFEVWQSLIAWQVDRGVWDNNWEGVSYCHDTWTHVYIHINISTYHI